MMSIRLTARVVLLVSLTSVPAFAQSTSPQTTPPATTPPAAQSQKPPADQTDSSDLPVDMNRIKQRLENPSNIKFNEKVKFYIEVVAKQYTFKDYLAYLGNRNLNDGGPVPGSQMTHQEFLDMVNPKILNSSAGFTATDTLQAALFNWAVGNVVKKGVTAIKNARSEAEVRAIRAQIDREISALRGGG